MSASLYVSVALVEEIIFVVSWKGVSVFCFEWFTSCCFTLFIMSCVNPYLTNGFSHHYKLDESTFIFRGVRNYFYFLFHFSMNFL